VVWLLHPTTKPSSKRRPNGSRTPSPNTISVDSTDKDEEEEEEDTGDQGPG